MRRDQCRFCTSRSCNHRIVSMDARRPWDEVSCRRHTGQLEALADQEVPGVYRTSIGSTDFMARGQPVTVDWVCLAAYRKGARERGVPLRPLTLYWAENDIPAGLFGEVPDV